MEYLDKKIYSSLRTIFVAVLVNMAIYQNVFAVGLMPVPEFNAFNVSATVNFDASTDRYSYNYSFTNPATTPARVWHIKLDISQPSDSLWNFSGLTIPFGTQELSFIDMYNRNKPLALAPGQGIVPIGQIVPEGWVGGFGRDGMASFAAGTGTLMIDPGDTKNGFVLISPGLPTIRTIEIRGHWVVEVENHDDVTDEDREAADAISANLSLVKDTVGPSRNITKGSFEHWNLLRDNINKAVEINWFFDNNFSDALLVKLQDARTAAMNQDGTLAKTILMRRFFYWPRLHLANATKKYMI